MSAARWLAKAVSLLLFVAVSAPTFLAAPQDDREIRARQVTAYRNGGLRAAASITGSYVGEIEHDELGSPSSLRALASSSQIIVVGRVESNVCRLSQDGFSIYTEYEVAVERPLKGPVVDRITLIVPGGRVLFENGNWAQLNISNLARPEDRRRYVFFLREAKPTRGEVRSHAAAETYVPAFGGLGIYPLTTRQGFIFPLGNINSPLSRSIVQQRLAPDAFVEYVMQLTTTRQ